MWLLQWEHHIGGELRSVLCQVVWWKSRCSDKSSKKTCEYKTNRKNRRGDGGGGEVGGGDEGVAGRGGGVSEDSDGLDEDEEDEDEVPEMNVFNIWALEWEEE